MCGLSSCGYGAPVPSSRRPRPPHEPPTRQRVARLRRRLRFVYGIPPTAPHHHPIAELVLTVLSQSTNDRNRDVAYLRLREFLPTWEQVRDAPVAEVERAIRPGGISKVKSVRLQAILRAIAADARRPGPRAVAGLAGGGPGRRGPRLPGGAPRSGSQDRRLRAAVRARQA